MLFEDMEMQAVKENTDRQVIKVKEDVWVNSRNELVIQKTVRQMRSLSRTKNGLLAFEEELHAVGVDAAETSLAGLLCLQPGLYEMYVKWCSHDRETGYVDDVEYGFKEIKEEKQHEGV